MSESTAKAQLDPEVGEGVSGYITPSDIQDAIGIIYDDFEAGDALRLSLGGGTLSGSLAGTSLSLSSTLAVTGNTTLTGDLTISKASASQTISSSAGQTSFNLDRIAGQYGIIQLRTGTSARWQMGIDSASESGSNAGSDFGLWAIDDNGSTTVTRALSITRSTGAVTLTGTLNGKVVNDLVTGPVSATDNALVRFDNTTGKVVQNSGITVDDSGNISSDLTVSKASPTLNVSASSGSAIVQASAATAATAAFRWRSGSGTTVKWAWIRDTDDGLYLYRYPSSGVINTVIDVSTGKWTFRDVGATAGLELGSSGPRMMSGTGSPEGSVTAPVGSIWFQSDSTVGVTHWKKASGSGNTGWVVMEGDTGLRNIASLANSIGTLTLGNWLLRRTGNVVTMTLIWADSQTTPYRVELGTLPYGFRPALTFYQHVPYDSTVNGYYRNLYIGDEGIVQYGGPTAANYHNGLFTWTTNNPWPTSLPGTAA